VRETARTALQEPAGALLVAGNLLGLALVLWLLIIA
jgi:hypothetical protein